jgi:hypothetical protein
MCVNRGGAIGADDEQPRRAATASVRAIAGILVFIGVCKGG